MKSFYKFTSLKVKFSGINIQFLEVSRLLKAGVNALSLETTSSHFTSEKKLDPTVNLMINNDLTVLAFGNSGKSNLINLLPPKKRLEKFTQATGVEVTPESLDLNYLLGESYWGWAISQGMNKDQLISGHKTRYSALLEDLKDLGIPVIVQNNLNYDKIFEIELEKAIEKQNSTLFQSIIKVAGNQVIANFVKTYLSDKNERFTSPYDDRINFLIDNLKKAYPHIDFDRLVIRHGYGLVVTPDGLRAMIPYLKEKGSLKKDAEILVCDNFSDFEKQLKNIDWKTKSKIGFLVRHEGRDCQHPKHVSPVYIEKNESSGKTKLDILITDSAGEIIIKPNKIRYVDLLAESIKEAIKPSLEYSIFVQKKSRQGDGSSCPIFSIVDMVEIFKQANPLNFIKNQFNPVTLIKTGEINFFDYILPGMMKANQGLTDLLNTAHMPQFKDEIIHFNKKTNVGETLLMNIKKHTKNIQINGNGKDINFYAQSKQIKFTGILFSKLIGENSSTKVRY